MKEFRSIKSEVYKLLSLRIFWLGFLVVLGVTVFFAVQNIQVINSLVIGRADLVNLDPTVLSSNPKETIREALLSSPYQASVLFLPILFALVCSTEYQFGQNIQTQLLGGSWQKRLFSQILAVICVSGLTTILLSLVNVGLILAMMDTSLTSLMTPFLVIDVTLRVELFTIVLCLVSLLCVKITHKSIPSLFVIVILLCLSLTGILRVISPYLDNLLPLIGAKSFAFAKEEVGGPTELYGLILLFCEGVLAVGAMYIVEKLRGDEV